MTTQIFKLGAASNRFGKLRPLDDASFDLFIDGFEGEEMLQSWSPPAVRLDQSYAPPGVPAPDFVSVFGSIPVVSDRVRDTIGELFADEGEFLPLDCDGHRYSAFNARSFVDIMDEEESEGDWHEPGRLMSLKRLVLRPDAPRELPPVFKLPQWRKGSVLVTEDFLDAVARHDLSGLAPRVLGST